MTLITLATDTTNTGGRGSPNPISPGSDGGVWTQQRGDQTATFVSNQIVLTFVASTNLGIWSYSGNSNTDQEVLINVYQSSGNTDIVGAVLRYVDSTHFYYADIGNISGSIEIGVCTPGPTFTTIASAPFSSSFGTKYTLRFQVKGQTLKAKIWDASAAEPVGWSVQGTDSTLFSGLYGLCGMPAGGTVKFDSFSATNGDNPPINPVPPAYGSEQPGLIAGATNADLVPAQDVSGYKNWSLQVDTIASGATLTFQGSNDNINYVSAYGYKVADATLVTSTTATGMFYGPRNYRYFRVRQTAWSSGVSKGTFELYI